MIPVSAGDFLGIFAGTIHFSEDIDLAHSILGPTENLYLDYSHVTGTLNQMQVSQQDAYASVRLEWQAVNEDDETGSCDYWRVMVLATSNGQGRHLALHQHCRRKPNKILLKAPVYISVYKYD